jgi:hypothetical protein
MNLNSEHNPHKNFIVSLLVGLTIDKYHNIIISAIPRCWISLNKNHYLDINKIENESRIYSTFNCSDLSDYKSYKR